MRRALLAALTLFVAGCFSTGTREAHHYYVLEVPATTTTASANRPGTLLIAPTTASSFYDTQDIVFSRSPGTRAYYQFNSWTERPGHRIYGLLASRLEQSGAFRRVAAAGSGVSGSLLLSTHLEEIYHDAAAAPGSATIRVSAELTDAINARLIARRTFTRSALAPTYDAPGAVRAFGSALGVLLDEIAAWVDEAAGR
jgi:cholesterol transport system auxiliary component